MIDLTSHSVFRDLKTFDFDLTELDMSGEVVNHFLFKNLKKKEEIELELKNLENGRVLLLKYRGNYVFIDSKGQKYHIEDFEKLNERVSCLKKDIYKLKCLNDKLSDLKNYA